MSSVVFNPACFPQPVCFKDKFTNAKISVRCSVAAQSSQKTVWVGVLGASGYTGAEIIRLLANHPHFSITLMTADRKAGQSIASVFPHLITRDLPDMVAVKDADFSDIDAVFCCLPPWYTTGQLFLNYDTGQVGCVVFHHALGLKIVHLSAVSLCLFYGIILLDEVLLEKAKKLLYYMCRKP